jgi:hypothetical protein
VSSASQALLSLGCVLATACIPDGDDFPPPRLASILPSSAPPGQNVTLLGEHFCAGPDDHDDEGTEPETCDDMAGSVQFGSDPALTSAWTSTSVIATVPSSAVQGETLVRITVGSRTSNSVVFAVADEGALQRGAAPTPTTAPVLFPSQPPESQRPHDATAGSLRLTVVPRRAM